MPPYYGHGGSGLHLKGPLRPITSASWLSPRPARYLALLLTFVLLALLSKVWGVRSLVFRGIVDAKIDSGLNSWQKLGVMQSSKFRQDWKGDVEKEIDMMNGDVFRKLVGGAAPLNIITKDGFKEENDVASILSQERPQFSTDAIEDTREDLSAASTEVSEILIMPNEFDENGGNKVGTPDDSVIKTTRSTMVFGDATQSAEKEGSFSIIAEEALRNLPEEHVDSILPLSLPAYDPRPSWESIGEDTQTNAPVKKTVSDFAGSTGKKIVAGRGKNGPETRHDVAREPTSLKHIVFGIASSMTSWPNRGPIVRSWFDRTKICGHVWVDSLPPQLDVAGPDIRVQSDTGHLQYTGTGRRDYLRMARIVKDSFQLSTSTWPPGSVRWFVMGDDDTFFNPGGISAILAKYDHTDLLYIGSQSETQWQNNVNSHAMAYGGGGFAISWPLAEALNRTLDSCLERHVELWGSDLRVAYCCAELGVKVTNENGFHQCDVGLSLSGFLEAHPLQVFASIHHVASLYPMYPGMADRTLGLQKMAQFMRPDPVGFVQQAICYDQKGPLDWTASISWGFSAKFYPKPSRFTVHGSRFLSLPSQFVRVGELEKMERTFHSFSGLWDPNSYNIDTRQPWDMSPLNEVCALPFAMYCTHVISNDDGSVESYYERSNALWMNRSHCTTWPSKLTALRVIRSQALQVPRSALGLSLGPNLIRQCCVRSSSALEGNDTVGTIWLGSCR